MLPLSVVVDEAWNGKCLRYEVCLYPLPYTLYMGRGNACGWHTVIKQRTDVGLVEIEECRSRRAIGLGGETGDIGESMIVRFEGKSRVKELLALSPFKEHPNRFGAA